MLIIFEIFSLCVSAALLVGLPFYRLLTVISFDKHDRLIKAVIIVCCAAFLAAGCVKIFTSANEKPNIIFRLVFLLSLMPYLYPLPGCVIYAFTGKNGFFENLAEAIAECYILSMVFMPLIPACLAGHTALLIGRITSVFTNINTRILYFICFFAGLLTFVIIRRR